MEAWRLTAISQGGSRVDDTAEYARRSGERTDLLDLIKNLIGCLVAGVVLFGLAVFREIEVEGHSTGSAVAVGFVVGAGVAAILGVLVFLNWRRDRRGQSAARDG